MTNDSLVVLRTFLNRFEADVAKSALDAAGIESTVRADDAGGMELGLWMSGVELIVRSEDAERAKALLRQDADGAG